MSFNHIASAVSRTGVQAEVLNEEGRKAQVIRLRERLGVDVRTRAPWEQGGEGKQWSERLEVHS